MEQNPDRDQQVKSLFQAGFKGREIAEGLELKESTVWGIVRRLGLHHRCGLSVHLRRDIARVETAVLRLGVPVTLDRADLPDGEEGYIAYVDDEPGEARVTAKAALRSAIAAWERKRHGFDLAATRARRG